MSFLKSMALNIADPASLISWKIKEQEIESLVAGCGIESVIFS